MFSYLVRAGDGQSVEEWNENLSGYGGHDGVGEPKEPKLGPEAVSLRRRADDGDARHEAGREGHGDGHGRHLPPPQQELSPAGVLAVAEGLEEAQPCRH